MTASAAAAEFTRIANDGTALPPDATFGAGARDWACVRDTRTDLVWEVKTADGGMRDQRWTYTPYDSNPATNGGYAGYKDATSGKCIRERMAERSCNTEAYVFAVREVRLCGFDDWRLPTIAELVAVASQATETAPGATPHSLPNVHAGWYWTGTEQVGVTNFARVILLPPRGLPTFYDGSYLILLVRGGDGR